jgi:hypothetical protein
LLFSFTFLTNARPHPAFFSTCSPNLPPTLRLQLLLALDLLLSIVVTQRNLGIPLNGTSLSLVFELGSPEGCTDGGGQGEDDRDDGDDVQCHGDGSEAVRVETKVDVSNVVIKVETALTQCRLLDVG